jgi:hypothetical protein
VVVAPRLTRSFREQVQRRRGRLHYPEYEEVLMRREQLRILKEIIQDAPVELRLKGLSPKERLKGLSPKERLKGLSPKERLKGLSPKEWIEGLSKRAREELYHLLQAERTGRRTG